MSNITTFRFPLENGTEFEIDFTTNPLNMCYRTPNSNDCNHVINVPFDIDIDKTGSDPIGTLVINPGLPVPPNAISISPSLRVKLNRDGIHINGISKGNSVTFKS